MSHDIDSLELKHIQNTVVLRRRLPGIGLGIGMIAAAVADCIYQQGHVHAKDLLISLGVGAVMGVALGLLAGVAIHRGVCYRCGVQCGCLPRSSEQTPLKNHLDDAEAATKGRTCCLTM